jgi:membrane protease YdiL (CAAX protease family)
MWMTLAAMSTLIELGFVFVSSAHFGTKPVTGGQIVAILVCIVLIAMIPFAVKINYQLGLPGGGLIAAKLNGEEQPYRWSQVLLGGVLWSIVGMVAFFFLRGFFVWFFAHPTVSAGQIHRMPIPKPSEIWLISSVVISAVSAGVREEILFRFVLMGVFSWALMIIRGGVDRRPSRGLIWLATILQAYCFGLLHLVPDFYLAKGIVGVSKVAIRTLVFPQTWIGIFYGRLYLSRGLETSTVAHIFWDLIWLPPRL